MSKALLLSIKPKWVAKILNGEKTIEIRKTMPKCDLPIEVYIYCTKDKEPCFAGISRSGKYTVLNGYVVAKFTLNKVEEIKHDNNGSFYYPYGHIRFMTDTLNEHHLLGKSCLLFGELSEYLYPNNYKGYAWYISNLVIFDRPKELGEFKHYNKPHCDGCPFQYSALCEYHIEVECDDIPLTKAPQSFQFIEVD